MIQYAEGPIRKENKRKNLDENMHNSAETNKNNEK
jgi:hypothetical protein